MAPEAKIHRSRRTYEPGRPVTPWMFAIARHVYLMNRRSAGRRQRFEDALAADIRSHDVPHDGLRTIVETDAVHRALRGVPADQRHALLPHHVEGWSFVEIAERLRHPRERRQDTRVSRDEEDEDTLERIAGLTAKADRCVR